MRRIPRPSKADIVTWMAKLSSERYTHNVRLDQLATSMRDFDDVTPHLISISKSELPDMRDFRQRLTDLRGAKLVDPDAIKLSNLGENVLKAWQSYNVANDNLDDELARHLILFLEARRINDPTYNDITGYWDELRDIFDPSSLINHWDKLFYLNFLDYSLTGIKPGSFIKQLGLALEDIDMNVINFIASEAPGNAHASDGAAQFTRAVKGQIPRGRHRATSAMALEIIRSTKEGAEALITEFGVPKKPTKWKPFPQKSKDIILSIFDGYVQGTVPEEVVEAKADKSTPEETQADEADALTLPEDIDFSNVLMDAPEKQAAPIAAGTKKSNKKIKKDYKKQASKNENVGFIGEEFVVIYEKYRLRSAPELARKVKWISKEDDGKGYDILSFDEDGSERYIEVKTTTNDVKTPFFISAPELRAAEDIGGQYHIYRVYNITTDPKLVITSYPFDQDFNFEAVIFRVTYK